jgi:hypothetical protein
LIACVLSSPPLDTLSSKTLHRPARCRARLDCNWCAGKVGSHRQDQLAVAVGSLLAMRHNDIGHCNTLVRACARGHSSSTASNRIPALLWSPALLRLWQRPIDFSGQDAPCTSRWLIVSEDRVLRASRSFVGPSYWSGREPCVEVLALCSMGVSRVWGNREFAEI